MKKRVTVSTDEYARVASWACSFGTEQLKLIYNVKASLFMGLDENVHMLPYVQRVRLHRAIDCLERASEELGTFVRESKA